MNTYRRKRKKRKKPEPKISPETQLLYDELCEALAKLGLELRNENGRFEGGYCLIDGKPYFYLNQNNLIDQNIQLMLLQLKSMDFENIFLSPRLREQLEEKESIAGE